MVNRRELLGWVGGAACVGLAPFAEAQPVDQLDQSARKSGRRFGFAVHPDYAQREPVRTLLQQHAGVITAENAMKWRAIEGLFGGRDYTQADAVAALADELHAWLRGHTLAWHQSTPARLTNATPEEFRLAQSAHLHDLVMRYKGRVHTWDVLNEVIDADARGGGGLRSSVLSSLWGVDRYPALFEQARALDPQAKLAYNDYGMEQDNPWCERRRTAVLHLLEDWVQRKTPIDTMGLQAHLEMSRAFSASRLQKFFDELQALGLSIQITELDVRDVTTASDIAVRDAGVAALYRDFMDVCMAHPAVEMVVLWNVTDADSWINRWTSGQRRADGLPMRPTLFDNEGRSKPSFGAVATSLRNASSSFVCPSSRTKDHLCSPKS